MAKNYIQPGEVIDHTAAANISSGAGVLIGKRLGVALGDIKAGATGSVAMKGVYSLPKLGTDNVAQGDELYWDNDAKRLTLDATDNTRAGYAAAAAGAGVATVNLALNA